MLYNCEIIECAVLSIDKLLEEAQDPNKKEQKMRILRKYLGCLLTLN